MQARFARGDTGRVVEVPIRWPLAGLSRPKSGHAFLARQYSNRPAATVDNADVTLVFSHP